MKPTYTRRNHRHLYRAGPRVKSAAVAPIPLFVERGQKQRVVAYSCPKCGTLHSNKRESGHFGGRVHLRAWETLDRDAAYRAASQCCGPVACVSCGGGIERQRGSYIHQQPCDSCRREQWRRRDLERLRKAKRMALDNNPTEYVYLDGTGWNEGYHESLDACIEWHDDEGLPPPCYVHPCAEKRLSIDTDWIIQCAVEDHHEDAVDHLIGVEWLVAFVEAWVAKQTLRSYDALTGMVIVLDERRFEALLATGEDPGCASEEALAEEVPA